MDLNELRAKLLGKNHLNKTIEIEIKGEKVKLCLRQIAIETIQKLKRIENKEDDPDAALKSNVEAVIESVIDPDTEKQVFTAADREGLKAQPEWVLRVAREVTKLAAGVVSATCPKCKADLPGLAKFCPACGEETPKPLDVVSGN